ncbi:MAG: hypothetical protein HY717_23160 [Planctomycetes bacterium]|nr:hypothetical protein [Planctomycetota bacterium]
MRVSQGLVAVLFSTLTSQEAPSGDRFAWHPLPALPGTGGDLLALAAGNGALLAARGDLFFMLESGAASWRQVSSRQRPSPLAAAVSADPVLFLLGGRDENGFLARAARLRWDGDALLWERLPDLPRPCARPGSALLGKTLYVIADEAPEPLRTFWALDLSSPQPR